MNITGNKNIGSKSITLERRQLIWENSTMRIGAQSKSNLLSVHITQYNA